MADVASRRGSLHVNTVRGGVTVHHETCVHVGNATMPPSEVELDGFRRARDEPGQQWGRYRVCTVCWPDLGDSPR